MAPIDPVLLTRLSADQVTCRQVQQCRSRWLSATPLLAHAGVVLACLRLLLRVVCIDISFQRRDGGLVNVDELYADVEYILGKAF
jgi:hypothetical protein